MASKFMVKKDLVELEIYYIEKNGDIIILKSEDMKKQVGSSLKTLKAKMLRMNNKLFNLCINGCIKPNDSGETYLDRSMFNDKRFRLLFSEAVDGDGDRISNSQSDIDNLMSELISAILEEYDTKIEEEKMNTLKKSGLIDDDGKLIKEEPIDSDNSPSSNRIKSIEE